MLKTCNWYFCLHAHLHRLARSSCQTQSDTSEKQAHKPQSDMFCSPAPSAVEVRQRLGKTDDLLNHWQCGRACLGSLTSLLVNECCNVVDWCINWSETTVRENGWLVKSLTTWTGMSVVFDISSLALPVNKWCRTKSLLTTHLAIRHCLAAAWSVWPNSLKCASDFAICGHRYGDFDFEDFLTVVPASTPVNGPGTGIAWACPRARTRIACRYEPYFFGTGMLTGYVSWCFEPCQPHRVISRLYAYWLVGALSPVNHTRLYRSCMLTG